jgi:hypothetical protein
MAGGHHNNESACGSLITLLSGKQRVIPGLGIATLSYSNLEVSEELPESFPKADSPVT